MRSLTLLLLFCPLLASSQVSQGLASWLSFDKPGCSLTDEANDPTVQTFPNGDLACDCGVKGNALFFDGDDDWFYFFGPKVEQIFSTIDFSLSFYFKPATTTPQSMSLFSKRSGCGSDNAFAIRYNPFSRIINVELTEDATISGSISKTLPYSCWYHIVVTRKGGTTTLFANGKELGAVNSAGSKRVNVANSQPLIIGDSECTVDNGFNGFLDEIRFYNRAINRDEVKALYLRPDQINNGNNTIGIKDTTIFLGNSVQAFVTPNCADEFLWKPSASVSDDKIAEPVLTPQVSTTYTLTFEDQFCATSDSFRVIVVDPQTIDCNDIMLPSAFTPNGDGLNDAFGISNPFVAGEIIGFDIYDRWGNIVFFTTDPLAKWNGSYKGNPVNPGVFVYKIRFRCKGVEGVGSGSVTVIR